MPRKSEVYTWRVSAATKASLEEAARTTNRTLAQLLDEIVAEHLSSAAGRDDSDLRAQNRLHERAARFCGRLSRGQADRSQRVRQLVRARLARRRHAGSGTR